MTRFVASPTGQAFLDSRKFVKIIGGPIGGGKSTVALIDLLQRAMTQTPFENVRRTRIGILRNTREQLRTTVKPILDTWFVHKTGGLMGKWKVTDNTFELRALLPDGTQVQSDFILLPADTPEDVRRLLSLELSSAWIEEAREVDAAVADALMGRVNRYPPMSMGGATYPGVTASTNAPTIGTYWHEKMVNPPDNTDVFMQPEVLMEDGSFNPDAENLANLAPDYYENLIDGKTKEWLDVYLRNKFGLGKAGRPVFAAAFKHEFHVAKGALLMVAQSLSPLVVGMDNGLQSAASITQRDARGRVNVLSECYVPEDMTMGVETFMSQLLIPHLQSRYPGVKNDRILFVLDPACFQRSQADEKTIAMVVQRYGFMVTRAPTNDPERRIQAVESLLAGQVDGGALMRFDPGCAYLIQGMQWGYRYKNNSAGLVRFEKNHFSHCAESLQYACLFHSGGGVPAVRAAREIKAPKRGYVYAMS